MTDLVPHIYHETQEPGSMLCGQHALNNLLQSAMYTVVDLAGIARELDALEASQLDPGTRLRGDDPREGSQNYDDSGFFSVQVMEEAIKVFGLRLVRWGSEEMAHVHDKPELIEGFLLNHQLHWFSIRRFGTQDRFYNLDSCIPQPQWISAMYLGLTLREAERQGYSIFAVVPAPELGQITGLPSCSAADLALSLPPPRGGNSYSNGSTSASFAGNGHTLAGPSTSRQAFGSTSSSAYKPPLASTASGSSSRKGKRPASDDDDDDDDIIIEEPSASGSGSGRSSVEQESEKRRRRRKIDGQNGGASGNGDAMGAMSEEEMMAAAIRESLRVSGQGGGGGTGEASQPRKGRGDVDEEEEFQRALQASLAENGGGGANSDAGNATESEASGDEGAEDSPSIDELRRLRLARFGM
ncbi:hypothetical protein NBRC10512_007610 [Rhodotorula toruloides]|uniref:ubiquitinyl hydrolase 1 n=2 Tax=Rhodotorula toruloides TaxID=5286 RepID=A0A061ARY6_RHOTO|nr:Machado-Joseph disease protein 1 (Ataxin-3) [Rhodotorula toruloides NP11]EMS20798.1 Machado-Joseph disease protein 1 (Ataxin-3) [Rhodotorula toruloides NP11]CDR40341.1 RHTO0S05e01904g1_1 [Rhodotorula toruloides]